MRTLQSTWGALLLLWTVLLWVPGASAQILRQDPGLLVPGPAVQPDAENRELLCYHAGAYYYVKIPHPVWGDVGRQYQRITPVGGGVMYGCELRLHNTWTGTHSHNGTLWLGVHRRSGQLPGLPEMLYPVPTDTLTSDVYHFYLPTPGFPVPPDEEVYLSLQFVPATPADTIAIVTAMEGTWTGHSFFLSGDNVSWWGTQGNVPYGDMHFCADMHLTEGAQPMVVMPWNRADLGRLPAGELRSWQFPVYNIGAAPLGTSLETPDHDRFTGHLDGPDSLMHPDTLFIAVDYEAAGAWMGDVVDSTLYRLHTNSPADSVMQFSLVAGSSTSELLLNDWNEWLEPGQDWELTFTQFADTQSTATNWDFYTGLRRPGVFVGHGPPTPGTTSTNVLAVRNLWLETGDYVRMRWSQHRRPGNGEGALHAIVWRNPQTGFWYVQNQFPLDEDPYLGPVGDWYTVPWILWGPSTTTGYHGFGLLYSGTNGDEWYIDDLEINPQSALPPPVAHITVSGHDVMLDWSPVTGAIAYRVTELVDGAEHFLAETVSTGWLHERGLQGAGIRRYRVRAVGPESRGCRPVMVAPLGEPVLEQVEPEGWRVPLRLER